LREVPGQIFSAFAAADDYVLVVVLSHASPPTLNCIRYYLASGTRT
jgi:hypothetical protein